MTVQICRLRDAAPKRQLVPVGWRRFLHRAHLGVKLSPEMASVLAMVINLSAHATEIVRAGAEATPRGQVEAALSLALFGINVPAWVVAAVALTLHTSAYLAEIWRGCVDAIPQGQWEAAQSLAMNFGEQLADALHAVLPGVALSPLARKETQKWTPT